MGIPVAVALRGFRQACGPGKNMTCDMFCAAYQNICQQNNLTAPDSRTQEEMFRLFDKDHNQVLDMMELCCGISLFCQGTEDDKIYAVFQVFDENGDGYISKDEMQKFLTSVFKVVLTPSIRQTLNSMQVNITKPEELASVTCAECFRQCDINADGKLNIEEFKKWFSAEKNSTPGQFDAMKRLLH